MAGTKNGQFKELISPYLKKQLEKYKLEKGTNSKEYQALYKQYIYDKKVIFQIPKDQGIITQLFIKYLKKKNLLVLKDFIKEQFY